MPAITPLGIALFVLQAAVGYGVYKALNDAGTFAAAVAGVCSALLGIVTLLEAGVFAALVVNGLVLGLAVIAGTRINARLSRI